MWWSRCFKWYLQDQFCDYMFQQAVKNDWKAIIDNKSKFLLVSFRFKNVVDLLELNCNLIVT